MKKDSKKILSLLSKGFKAVEIGEKMNISPRTVEKKIEILKEAHNAKNVTHLACIALREGIIK